jgi:NADPH:quinone reductase-like Zn-dependent oxidoreductase
MRAVQLTAYGNPVEGLKYVDIPAPDAPGPNQVLIGVEFCPINPSDLMLVQGIYALHPALPSVIGRAVQVPLLHLEDIRATAADGD